MIGEQATHVVAGRTAFSSSLRGVPGVGELFDVVDQAEELPLPVDLAARIARDPKASQSAFSSGPCASPVRAPRARGRTRLGVRRLSQASASTARGARTGDA